MKKKLSLLFAICAAATLGAAALICSSCGDNKPAAHDEHMWEAEYTTESEATCTAEGKMVRHCLIAGCDAVDEKIIPKIPHRYGREKNTATCLEGGNMVRECQWCGDKKIGEATEPKGHDMEIVKVTTEATCYQTGLVDKKCANCDYSEENVVVEKTPHSLVKNLALSVAATCTKEGKDVYDCITSGCGWSEEHEVEELGHDYDYTSFQYPTFKQAGHREGVCRRAGCGSSVNEDMAILKEGDKIDFEFKVVRRNGETLTTYAMKITVKNWKDEVVAEAEADDLTRGILHVQLPVYEGKNYTMTATGLINFTSQSVEVSPEKPVGNLVATANPIYSADESNVPILNIGNIAQDFIAKDLDGKEVHLADLLAKNKLVVIKVFRTQCPWCDTEFPGFVKAYTNYKDKGVAAIGLAPVSYGWPNNSDLEELKAKVKHHDLTFPVIQDMGENGFIHAKYKGVLAAPCSIFIDHEGVIVDIRVGYQTTNSQDLQGLYTQDAFEEIFKQYTSYEWDDMKSSTSNQIVSSLIHCDYMLPSRDE